MKYPAMLLTGFITLTAATAAPEEYDAAGCSRTAQADGSRTTAKSKTEKPAPPAVPQPAPTPTAPAPRRDPPTPPPHLFM